ncbi:MAG: serine/threonine-protein kinase [Phycisphaerae bacterium]
MGISPDRWRQINELFEAAAALPPAARTGYLDQACGDDADLRRQVQRLLTHDERAGDFLRNPTRALPESTDAAAPLAAGLRIGAYRLVRQVAAGGMGSVWLAERADEQFQGRVAVKFLHSDLGTADILERFRQERQLLANLRHPNISRLLDGGVAPDGRPYLILEFIDGLPIDRFCDQRRLTIVQRIELFRTVCGAVQFAHQNLVVHRDMKPGNILVSADGVPTLLDFGIAKVLESGELAVERHVTQTGHRLMTPAYASPEQIRGEPITTASDIYSLGVVLYELLAGRAPYTPRDDSLTEFERAVCEQAPQPPSTAIVSAARGNAPADPVADADHVARRRATDVAGLRRRLRGDLDTIVLMALRKEPERRYATAEQLADDLGRYLRGLPVRARPDTIRYRGVKFVRRNRLAVALAAAIFVLLSTLTVVTQIQSARVAAQSMLAADRYALMQQVAEFQSALLGGIEPDAMGQTIRNELRRQVQAGLAQQWIRGPDGTLRRESPAEIAAALQRFDDALAPGNLTDVARRMLDASVLRPGLAAIERRFSNQPDVDAKLRYTIGSIYRSLALYDAGEPELRRALALQRKLYPQGHLDIAATENELGLLLQDEHRYVDAEPLFRDSLALRQRLLPADHVELARGLNNLGTLLLDRRDLESAEPLLRDALAMRRRLLGDEHAEVAQSLHNVSGLLALKRDFAAAEPLCREALRINRKVYGNESSSVAWSLNNLAGLLAEQGDFAGATPLAVEALAIRTQLFGTDHPITLVSINNLAGMYIKQGRFGEAEPLARQALTGWSRRRPAGDPSVAMARLVLAVVLDGEQRHPEAEQVVALGDWDALLASDGVPIDHKRRILKRLAEMYSAWRKPGVAARWQARLAEPRFAEQSSIATSRPDVRRDAPAAGPQTQPVATR